MTVNTTTYWGLPSPADNENVDVPADIQALAEALDDVTKFSSGLAASRPTSSGGTPGKRGRFYWSTDTAALEFDTGTSWAGLNVKTFYTVMSFTRGEDDYWPEDGKKVGHFRVRLAAGQTVALATAEHMLDSGADTELRVQKNGTNITGWTGIIPTTSQAQTNPTNETLADGDRITVVCTEKGTGKGGFFELVLLHTV